MTGAASGIGRARAFAIAALQRLLPAGYQALVVRQARRAPIPP